MRLVIFDFDGTLHLAETPRIFLRVLRRDKKMQPKIRKFYLSMSWVYVLYRFGLCRQLAIRLVMVGIAKMLKSLSPTQIDAFFRQCLELAKENFSPVSQKRIKAHLQAGEQILLLSGAFAQFVALVAKDLGMNYWLGTELEYAKGSATGRLSFLMTGEVKVQALQSFLEEREKAGQVFDLTEAYAYADSIQDLPLLTLVAHPVAVNPDGELLQEAQQRGWEIIRDGA